jgi:formylglycine-generating enzyme required for sulfatase activity
MKRIFLATTALAACTVLAQERLTTSQTKSGIGMEFVQVNPGEFMMGCSVGDIDCNADERPIHHVKITKLFQIGKFEVTQAQWTGVMGSNPSTMKGDDRPVETVNKDEAHQFLSKLNAQNDGYRYRLPSEAEWEYAARAGSATPYTGRLDEVGWFDGNSGDETHPVGQKKPNAWGLYDMEGNVKEWVEDNYSQNYYSNTPETDPTGPQGGQRGGFGGRRGGRGGQRGRFGGGGFGGPAGQPPGPPPGPSDLQAAGGQRGRGGRGGRGGPGGPGGGLPIMRGGGWDNPAYFLRVSARYSYYGSTLRVSDVGFRVVREPVN